MKRIFCLLLSLAAGCGYDDFGNGASDPGEEPLPNMRIATLRALCADGPVRIAGEGVVLSGYVTTSDRENNFYRSFFIEDNSGGAEVLAGLYDLHNAYPTGQRVTLLADGLTASLGDDLLRIGLEGASERYPVAYMESRLIAGAHLRVSGERIVPAASPVTAGRLSGSRVGTLVCVGGLKAEIVRDTTWAVPASVSPTGAPLGASLKFRDAQGDSLYVVTSGYASFAAERVPRGRVSVTGILLRGAVGGKTVYQLKIRDLNDVQND